MEERKEVVKFLKKFLIAAVFCLLFFGTSTALLFMSGELLTPEQAVDRQMHAKHRALYGCYFSVVDLYYKWHSALLLSPKIMVLGTSRSLELRSAYFLKDAGFFNAGAPSLRMAHLSYFLNSIPKGKEPNILILALDQFSFNSSWEKGAVYDVDKDFHIKTGRGEIIKRGCVGVYNEILKNGFPRLSRMRDEEDIGLYAAIENTGYRKDGSFLINTSKIKPTRFNDSFRMIEQGRGVFAYGNSISTGATTQLDDFLSLCKSRNIYVIAFLTPFPHMVCEKMKAMNDKYGYLKELKPLLSRIFKKYSFGFHDYSDLASTGASDQETIDGYHGSEKAYLRLFIDIVHKEPVLRKYTNINYLEKRLSSAESDFLVFGDEE
jgi:hypothetical protein